MSTASGPPLRLVLVEDDPAIAGSLRRGLAEEGFAVEWIQDGIAGRARLVLGGFDMAIVDVMLPGVGGLEVIAAARAARVTAPMLVLSARDRVEDRVRGLDLGADDYLVKPFAFAELLARLRALARRVELHEAPGEPFVRGRLSIDAARREASYGDRALPLTPTELLLLDRLARRGDVVSRRELLRDVWGYHFDPGTNVIDVHVGRLRKKLADARATVRVLAVRGVGYRVDIPADE